MLKGSCLCRGVRYEIDGEIEKSPAVTVVSAGKCQAPRFPAALRFRRSRFVLLRQGIIEGMEHFQGYSDNSSCGRCGSRILKRKTKDRENLRLRVGTLDTDRGIKLSKHIHVASKAPWVEITDGLPHSE